MGEQTTVNLGIARLRQWLELVTTVALLVTALALLWFIFVRPSRASRTIPLPGEPMTIEGVALLGSATAPVVVIEFSDFQCPFCGRFAKEVLPQIREAYVDTGRVQLAFRHLPLRRHDRARRAAEAGECSTAQGKFWPMHDQLFIDTNRLGEADLLEKAQEVGLDETAFRRCMEGEAEKRVSADVELAGKLGLTGTPSFLVGRRQPDGRVRIDEIVAGAKPLEEFKRSLDKALNSAARGTS